MSENTNISNYMFYLAYLNKKLTGFFENQTPYIKCKKGCSKCCRNGKYPFSKIEFDYLMVGFLQLPVEIQEKIKAKIKKIRKAKSETYECPFLFNNQCCVYEFRGIICRSFGLMSINNAGASKIPFCTFENLNYSNVVDFDTKIISQEKYKKLGNVNEPLAFNTSYSFLTSKNIERNFHIEFGDKKALIDWFN